jgi:NAD(P)H dehydrogenase (quinone)
MLGSPGESSEGDIHDQAKDCVTGATGKTGSVVVSELLKAGYLVRAIVHRERGRSARLKSQGAEIVAADMSDEARLEHIVGLTQWLASPSHPSLMTRQSWLIDHLFSMTPGVTHMIVNPGFIADDYLVPIGLAAHLGMFPWMYGNSRNAPRSNEDIARVVATALMDPARHAGKSYRPTGPKLLGAKKMVQAIGRAVGRTVRVMPTPAWLFMKSERIIGHPIDAIRNIRYYIEDHK